MTRYRCPFWLAVLLTGIGTGVAAAALTRLLEMVQHVVWNGSGTHLLDAAGHAGAWRHILVLLGRINSVAAGQAPQDDLPRLQQYDCRDRALRGGTWGHPETAFSKSLTAKIEPDWTAKDDRANRSLLYRDKRLSGFDAAALIEVIEHLDRPRVAAMERVVFEFTRPRHAVVTTPNREYITRYFPRFRQESCATAITVSSGHERSSPSGRKQPARASAIR
jgi:hypothetical protein